MFFICVCVCEEIDHMQWIRLGLYNMYGWSVFGMQRRGEKGEKRREKRERGDPPAPPWQLKRETSLGRGGGVRGWEGGVEERLWKEEKIRGKQSTKNVNTVAKMQTKDTKHSSFLSLTLLSLSLCGQFSGIRGLRSVTKQPESCRKCVRETESEYHAW